jgi:serine/threonine-protein kinase
MTAIVDRLVGALAQQYCDVDLIGRGGMAYVFRATPTDGGAPVAIKMLDPRVSVRIARERFLREIVVCTRLHHPCIVPIIDSGEIDDNPFYVMPYLEEGSLRTRLIADGSLPMEHALAVGCEVAEALAHAHAQGVMHRDVKPENILCRAEHVLVTDFGFARAFRAAAGERLTRAGEILGTPEYMSPEQALGRYDIDSTCDIYALGCVLYELLTGHTPFPPSDPDTVLVRRLKDAIPCVRDERQDVPDAVEELLIRSLEWNPRHRLNDAAEFGRILRSAAALS